MNPNLYIQADFQRERQAEMRREARNEHELAAGDPPRKEGHTMWKTKLVVALVTGALLAATAARAWAAPVTSRTAVTLATRSAASYVLAATIGDAIDGIPDESV